MSYDGGGEVSFLGQYGAVKNGSFSEKQKQHFLNDIHTLIERCLYLEYEDLESNSKDDDVKGLAVDGDFGGALELG